MRGKKRHRMPESGLKYIFNFIIFMLKFLRPIGAGNDRRGTCSCIRVTTGVDNFKFPGRVSLDFI
jgi:hypothetical protein